MKDYGTITNMDLLPIMGFNNGPLEFELEQAKVTIGPLKCKGLKQISDAFLKPVGPPGLPGPRVGLGPVGSPGPHLAAKSIFWRENCYVTLCGNGYEYMT